MKRRISPSVRDVMREYINSRKKYCKDCARVRRCTLNTRDCMEKGLKFKQDYVNNDEK